MKGATTAAAVVLAVVAAGCSSGAEAKSDASVCALALDEADRGFDAFAANIRVVQQALDQAFDGNLRAANSTLDGVQRVSPDRYKQLEQECRDAVG